MRAIRLAREKRTPITGIILNKVHNKDFELSLKQIEETSGCSVLGVIPHDLSVIKAISGGFPSTLKNSSSTKEYRKLAASILGEDYKESKIKTFVRRFFSNVPKHEVNQTIFKNERRSNPFYQ
jgi:MinD-like ATPase involved in chromosome partitioning or flagellar assembly